MLSASIAKDKKYKTILDHSNLIKKIGLRLLTQKIVHLTNNEQFFTNGNTEKCKQTTANMFFLRPSRDDV